MTKILFWNVATFGINKINNTSAGYDDGFGGLNNLDTSVWRRRIVYRTIQNTQPDIIVIVEASSGDSYPNDLATFTGGMQGCIYLLNMLRTSLVYSAGDWRLVPLLRVGRADGSKPETVAILYRGRSGDGAAAVTRYFTGPNIWTGGYAGLSREQGTAVRAAYPAAAGGNPDILSMLVPAGSMPRRIPGNALYNADQLESTVAARTQFREDNGGVPGGFLNFQVYRPPYLATFTEVSAAGTRNLSVFGIHSPAVAGDSRTFIVYLSQAYDVASALGANEIRIIGGDFNVNLLDEDGDPSDVYLPLTNLNYQKLLRPNGAPPVDPVELATYKGYFATHIRPKKYNSASKFLWSDGDNDSNYPGYGYVGSNRVREFYSIDNILVNPFNALRDYRTTIMNHVTGTPFNRVAMPPGNPPIGSIAMPEHFTNTNGWPVTPTANDWTLGSSTNLTSWVNYNHIYQASDHFALYAEI